jgi:hypothetical protein
MTDRKIFGLVVRVLGLVYILWSLEWLFSPLIAALKQPQQTQEFFRRFKASNPRPSRLLLLTLSHGWCQMAGVWQPDYCCFFSLIKLCGWPTGNR